MLVLYACILLHQSWHQRLSSGHIGPSRSRGVEVVGVGNGRNVSGTSPKAVLTGSHLPHILVLSISS
jgi:hypothetical protein